MIPVIAAARILIRSIGAGKGNRSNLPERPYSAFLTTRGKMPPVAHNAESGIGVGLDVLTAPDVPYNEFAMTTTEHLMTATELLQTPGLGRCELVQGELIPMTPAECEHGRIAAEIG